MSNVPRRETFETMYARKAPWDIGKPQRAFVEVADHVTGEVLDAGCGTGENALFFAETGPSRAGHRLPRRPDPGGQAESQERGLDAEFVQWTP